MLANSTPYSHQHPHHPHNYQSTTSALFDNMSGWKTEYAAAPRDAAVPSATVRPSYHSHASSSSVHDLGTSTPTGMTISQSSPALPFPTWDDNQQHMTSSNSSPSLVFHHGMVGHADSPDNNFAYNANSSAGYRPSNAAAGQYQGHSMSKTYLGVPTSSSQAAAAMYHQHPVNAAPYQHHQFGSSNTSAATTNPLLDGGMTDQKPSSLQSRTGHPVLPSPMQPLHDQHQQHHREDSYTSTAPVSNGHHYHPHHHHHLSTSSPNLNDYNTEYRSSHMLHPFEVKHRRRTTRTQFKVLEATFKENPKPNASVRKSVSQQLDMPIRAVQIWFQNRRAKAKAIAKREASGHSGEVDAEEDGYADHNDTLEDERYSSSPTSSLRPTTAGPIDTSSMGYTTPASASSETFKIPHRPLRIDTEASNRRMTTGAMPTSGTFAGNTFYHSPPLSSSGSFNGPYSSHLPNSSPSYDGISYSRPTSLSLSSNLSAPYDDRHRRGVMTSPGVLQHDGVQMAYPSMNSHRHSQQPFHQQYNQQQHSQQMDMQLPSAFDPETRRLSLPENIPAEVQISGNLSIMQQQQQQHLQHQQQYQQAHHHHHRSADGDGVNPQTDYWRY